MAAGYSQVSLFETILEHFDDRLIALDCTKAMMIQLSHSLENIVLEEKLPAVLLTGFQESKHWRLETERYAQLAEVAHQLCIFSGGHVPPAPNEKHIHIKLVGDDPLRQEWFVCILTEKFSVILCGQDQQEQEEPVEQEALRRFATLWSFEPDIVDEVMDLLERVVEFYQSERLQSLRDSRCRFPPTQPDARLLTNFTRDMIRFEEQLYHAARKELDHRLEIEQQLIQSQKMEAVGRLAGGVAHDFNNLLTAILGYAELALTLLSSDDELRGYVQQIHQSSSRAASLTAQLLAFSRKQVIQPRILNLNDIVSDSSRLLRRLIGEHIHLRTDMSPALWKIEADPAQLQQVVVNVAINARDAMPEGGVLTLETKNIVLSDGYARQILDWEPGHCVLLSISDTGHGMDQETLGQIFEPFFTTKGPDHGTGLGLSTVYGIVKQSRGHITAHSEPGQGTVIKVYWPAVERTQAVAEASPSYELPPQGTETILVVEDEQSVRQFIVSVLKESGYKVLVAQDGKEAQNIFKTHRDPIHVLLTDVVMPHVSGRQVAEEIVRYHPNIKVIFMSGYTDDAIGHHGVLEANVNFLQKPFSPVKLGLEIKKALKIT